MNQKLIKYNRSVIPACDMWELDKLEEIISATYDLEGIGGYKIGKLLAYWNGLPEVIKVIKKYTDDKAIIFDGQKEGNDIPSLGSKLMQLLANVDIDGVILFPFAGGATQREWTKAAQEQGICVLIGGEMTQPEFKFSEGGTIADEALELFYERGIEQGVTNFVVPGNKIDRIEIYKSIFKKHGVDAILYSPGLIAQGGNITDAGKVAGDKWHAIIGRAIYEAKDKRAAAIEMVSQII